MLTAQQFRDFVNGRLAAVAVEICGQYGMTVSKCQEEIHLSREKCAKFQSMLKFLQPVVKLHRLGWLTLLLTNNYSSSYFYELTHYSLVVSCSSDDLALKNEPARG